MKRIDTRIDTIKTLRKLDFQFPLSKIWKCILYSLSTRNLGDPLGSGLFDDQLPGLQQEPPELFGWRWQYFRADFHCPSPCISDFFSTLWYVTHEERFCLHIWLAVVPGLHVEHCDVATITAIAAHCLSHFYELSCYVLFCLLHIPCTHLWKSYLWQCECHASNLSGLSGVHDWAVCILFSATLWQFAWHECLNHHFNVAIESDDFPTGQTFEHLSVWRCSFSASKACGSISKWRIQRHMQWGFSMKQYNFVVQD